MTQNSIGLSQRKTVREIMLRAQARNQSGARFMRRQGTDHVGRPFTGLEKATVWLNAAIIPGKDISLWRQDSCGAHMFWRDYGNTGSKWGWEVDHVMPLARGGTDAITNLQALHWQNNRSKADRLGGNYCVVSQGL